MGWQILEVVGYIVIGILALPVVGLVLLAIHAFVEFLLPIASDVIAIFSGDTDR